MSLSRKSKLNIMYKIGRKLGECRRRQNLCLEYVSANSGIPWQMIDTLELGCKSSWYNYQKLLDLYDKELVIELIDRDRKLPALPPADSVSRS